MSSRRGRPLKDDARRHQVKTLFDDVEYEKMKTAIEKYGVSQSDIMRRGMELAISELESNHVDEDEEFFNYDYWDEYTEEEESEDI